MGNVTHIDDFEEDPPEGPVGDAFVVDLEGFEGPLDLLLTLARQQKVDLTNISILTLAEQYLAYIQAARRLRLEVAADYLVMAAWLAYLKSRILLPPSSLDEEPTDPPTIHMNVESKAPWYEILDDRPQFQGLPPLPSNESNGGNR